MIGCQCFPFCGGICLFFYMFEGVVSFDMLTRIEAWCSRFRKTWRLRRVCLITGYASSLNVFFYLYWQLEIRQATLSKSESECRPPDLLEGITIYNNPQSQCSVFWTPSCSSCDTTRLISCEDEPIFRHDLWGWVVDNCFAFECFLCSLSSVWSCVIQENCLPCKVSSLPTFLLVNVITTSLNSSIQELLSVFLWVPRFSPWCCHVTDLWAISGEAVCHPSSFQWS